jgi:uridine kinase
MMEITPADIRQEVQVIFNTGQVFNGPAGTLVEEFIRFADLNPNGKIVAAVVSDHLRELSMTLHNDANIVPVTMADSDGVRIYRRSLSFLMIAAAHEVFPGEIITIQHSMPFGGYYTEREGGQSLSPDELDSLKSKMLELVEADLPITHVKVPLDEALQLFRDSGDTEKADLFSMRRKDYLTLYELAGVRDYFHGFMVPSTGYLDLFDLRLYSKGFIIQFPRRRAPNMLQPFQDEPRLARVFQEYDDWLSVIGVPSVAVLNRAIRAGRIQEVILVAEALHNRQLASIASDIASCRPDLKIVMISGPSSAGKTTLSKRLAIQLLAMGIHPVAINMDNYFVDRDHTPKDEQGEYDFEALEAVDVTLLLDQLHALLAGRTIEQPRYNFQNGQREIGPNLKIESEQVILIEGIHGLNPRIVDGIPPEATYSIFVSAFTQLNLDRHNRVPTTDTRLLRRIVRDASRRGYSAADTIKRWPSVRRGEKRHIFPNQSNANVFFNSALVYELSVLKSLAQPLLLQVENQTKERIEANRLLAFLQWFDPVSGEGIPSDSILREFIGGTILEKFEPWRH